MYVCISNISVWSYLQHLSSVFVSYKVSFLSLGKRAWDNQRINKFEQQKLASNKLIRTVVIDAVLVLLEFPCLNYFYTNLVDYFIPSSPEIMCMSSLSP